MSGLNYLVDDVSNGIQTFGSEMRSFFGDFDLSTVALVILLFIGAVIVYDVIIWLLLFTDQGRSYNSLSGALLSKAWDYRHNIDINPADYLSARSLEMMSPVTYAIKTAIQKYEH